MSSEAPRLVNLCRLDIVLVPRPIVSSIFWVSTPQFGIGNRSIVRSVRDDVPVTELRLSDGKNQPIYQKISENIGKYREISGRSISR